MKKKGVWGDRWVEGMCILQIRMVILMTEGVVSGLFLAGEIKFGAYVRWGLLCEREEGWNVS